VAVYLTETHGNSEFADGTTVDYRRKPGEVAWSEALMHQTENVDDHPAVEIK